MTPTIALLTDFGTTDTYVGVMKGVIARIAPDATVIDVTHSVPPGDVANGAFQLWKAVRYFPEDAIFVIVVDPGVGTERRPIGARWQNRQLIAPDNGILSYLLAQADVEQSVELQDPRFQLENISTTFHGRDIFAPAGAHLAAGVPLQELGPALESLKRIRLPTFQRKGEQLQGEVVHIDQFGNLITSIGRIRADGELLHINPWLREDPPFVLTRGEVRAALEDRPLLQLDETFGDVPPGELVAYIGSEGLLEVAVNQGSAAERLGARVGDRVHLTMQEAS
ncbi:MAG: SAM-dependent chlorinase/fluorinase [Anaerolineales bacterium]|nr:SAM-dependent chlorinase/fluorinase [Anaerolineales bacterium]